MPESKTFQEKQSERQLTVEQLQDLRDKYGHVVSPVTAANVNKTIKDAREEMFELDRLAGESPAVL